MRIRGRWKVARLAPIVHRSRELDGDGSPIAAKRPNTRSQKKVGHVSGSAAAFAVYAIAETGMVCAASGQEAAHMLRMEEKYLPGPQEHDDTMTEETGRHEPVSGDERRQWAEAAAFEEASEATLEAAVDPGREAAFDPRIGRVLSVIKGNPFVTIGDLSRVVNLSHSRLSHLFKATQGVSLNSFLANRRMERAAQLLRSTEMQIKEITYDAGYKQVPSFVRAFHKRFGASPTRYRMQRRTLTNSRLD
jgi:AraC-like DNA-binding protein